MGTEPLAARLGQLAVGLREVASKLFEQARGDQAGEGWAEQFGPVSSPLRTPAALADSYAQWVVYCLLIDRCGPFEPRHGGSRSTLHGLLPPGLRLPDDAATGLIGQLESLVRLLSEADVPATLERIGRQMHAQDPLAHFYESFLSVYDPHLRRLRGVYYTPAPLVSYLVRSVEHVLRTQFDLPAGLAPSAGAGRLRMVDPACGSGTFLLAVVERIRRQYLAAQDPRGWPDYVQRHLLPSLLGFELLPAPWRAAHLLLGRQLAEAGWYPDPELPIRLGNPLAGPTLSPLAGHPLGSPLLVVLGNPPYANFGRQNRSPWIRELLGDYKQGLNEKKQNLADDFIKFIRWSQFWVDHAGQGVVALVTSNTYLRGLTHRQMRRSLIGSFSEIYLLDLHGSFKKRETAPDGSPDENVFGIQQGVALGLFVKRPEAGPAKVYYADLWGSRQHKYETLSQSHVGSTGWTELQPAVPQYFFVPPAASAGSRPYPQPHAGLDELFCEYISGVQTKNDALLIGRTADELAERMRAVLQTESQPQLSGSRPAGPAAGAPFSAGHIRPCLVAPFDKRWIYYDRQLVGRSRYQVMQHMLQDNLGLVFMRQSTNPGTYDHFLAVRSLVTDRVFYSAHGAPFLAPLYRYGQDGRRTANLNARLIRQWATRLRWQYLPEGPGDLRTTFGPQDVFHYLYAVFHCPGYRQRYADELRMGFPRVPLSGDHELLRRRCQWGRRLVELHCPLDLPCGPAAPDEAAFPIAGDNLVARGFPKSVPTEAAFVRIYINTQQYFERVATAAWDLRIGGYAVLARWLRQRRGTRLTAHELAHARRLAPLLTETAQLMLRIGQGSPTN